MYKEIKKEIAWVTTFIPHLEPKSRIANGPEYHHC